MSPCAAVILDVGRGSRRLNSHESRPRALYTGPDGEPLLDWINASLRHAQADENTKGMCFHGSRTLAQLYSTDLLQGMIDLGVTVKAVPIAGGWLEIDTVADYNELAPILSDRGYGDEDIAKIMYRNWQRFYEEHLPAN